MIHVSGSFNYQRPGLIAGPSHVPGVGPVERQPGAFYLGVVLWQDNGEPVFGGEVDDPSGHDVFPVGASVVLSRPQVLFGGSGGFGLSLTLDTVLGNYLGLIGTLDPVEASRLPADWIPLALGIWGRDGGLAVLTAAPEPIPVTGIMPPVRLGTTAEPTVA
jgi:hypothetical protein